MSWPDSTNWPSILPGLIEKLHCLDGIAEKPLDIPEMIPQDLTQCAANDLNISANAMPKVIPAHPINDITFFVRRVRRPCISVCAAATAS